MSVSLIIALLSLVLLAVGIAAGIWILHVSTQMPGVSAETLPDGPLGSTERELSRFLRKHVQHLAAEIGPRSIERYDNLSAAALYIQQQFESYGYKVELQEFSPGGYARPVANVIARRIGSLKSNEYVVIGAHYDSVGALCPGADDNASGVAALLWLAQQMKELTPSRSVSFVAFVNEEPPFFKTRDMGSYRYAEAAKARGEQILAMVSLESLGSYSDIENSQQYPPPLSWYYPNRGNFVGFVGNWQSAEVVRRSIATFRTVSRVPSQGFAAPSWFPGVSWSDQWSFWQFGFPALMITDTAPFRNQYYHTEFDRWDTLDYATFARVMPGVEAVIRDLIRQ